MEQITVHHVCVSIDHTIPCKLTQITSTDQE